MAGSGRVLTSCAELFPAPGMQEVRTMKWDKDVKVDNIKLAITVRRLESWPVVHDSVDVWYEDLATILEWWAELQSNPVMAFLPGEKYKKFE